MINNSKKSMLRKIIFLLSLIIFFALLCYLLKGTGVNVKFTAPEIRSEPLKDSFSWWCRSGGVKHSKQEQ